MEQRAILEAFLIGDGTYILPPFIWKGTPNYREGTPFSLKGVPFELKGTPFRWEVTFQFRRRSFRIGRNAFWLKRNSFQFKRSSFWVERNTFLARRKAYLLNEWPIKLGGTLFGEKTPPISLTGGPIELIGTPTLSEWNTYQFTRKTYWIGRNTYLVKKQHLSV